MTSLAQAQMSEGARTPARDLAASGLLDLDWISAQLGVHIESLDDAARAVITTPDISPHPLFEATWLPGKGVWQAGDLPASLWYVTEKQPRRQRLAPHPLINAERILEQHPESRDHEFGPLAWWAAHADDDTPVPVRPGYPELRWGDFRREALRGAREWQVLSWLDANPGARQLGTSDQDPAVSVLMCTHADTAQAAESIAALRDQTLDQWELVVVDRGSDEPSLAELTDLASTDSRVRIVLAPHSTYSHALACALDRSRGDCVAFLEPGQRWHPEHLARTVGVLRASETSAVRAFTGPDTRTTGALLDGEFDLGTTVVRRSAIAGSFVGDSDAGAASSVLRSLRERPDVTWADPIVLVRGLAGPEPETVNWAAAASRHRVESRTSVVLPMGQGFRGTIDWLLAGGDDVEVTVVASRDRRGPHVLTSALARLLPRVTSVSVPPSTNLSAALNIGVAHSTGGRLVLVRPEAQPALSILEPLAAATGDPSVAITQPLVLDRRGVVITAGAGFPSDEGRLELLFFGHPASDVRRLGRRPVAAPTSPVLAVRASTFLALRGLDTAYSDVLAETDLGLRAHHAQAGASVVLPDLTVTSRTTYAEPLELKSALTTLRAHHPDLPVDASARLWEDAGFVPAGVRTHRLTSEERDSDAPSVLLHQRLVRHRLGIHENPPRLRWTIDTAAPSGGRGERWGDTHFARSLASAFEGLGQDVSVDARDARDRQSRQHDDVVLVLRGLDLVQPHPTALNMQWIISHPDLVSPAEVKGFDLVYAASLAWPERVRREWGVDVTPLLQCTDPRFFHPDRGTPDTGPAVLFVGNSRGVFRQSVRMALAIGADLTVHGADWEEFIDPSIVASHSVPNDEVGALYGSAGVVLNDHHVDMRRDSFLSNRLFDAAACGARIASDPVDGLAQTFGDLVRPFETERELRRLIADREHAFPDDERRHELARRISAEHSFEHRAELLLADAVRALRQRTA